MPHNYLDLSRCDKAHIHQMEVTMRYTLTLRHSVRQFLSQHCHGHLTDSDSDSQSVRTVEVRACKLENCFQGTLEYSPLMSLLYCLFTPDDTLHHQL